MYKFKKICKAMVISHLPLAKAKKNFQILFALYMCNKLTCFKEKKAGFKPNDLENDH